MPTKEKKSKRQRREEIMARVNRERQQEGAGSQLSGPQGVGAPRATGSEIPARGSEPQKGRQPVKPLPE